MIKILQKQISNIVGWFNVLPRIVSWLVINNLKIFLIFLVSFSVICSQVVSMCVLFLKQNIAVWVRPFNTSVNSIEHLQKTRLHTVCLRHSLSEHEGKQTVGVDGAFQICLEWVEEVARLSGKHGNSSENPGRWNLYWFPPDNPPKRVKKRELKKTKLTRRCT